MRKLFEIAIPIHSFIDVVTNSSTSIYVGCHDNTIKFGKELINSILKMSGSDKTADDLFTFHVTANFEEECDGIIESLEEYYSESELEGLDYSAEEELAKVVFNKMLSGEIEETSSFGKNHYDYDTRTLIIKSKSDDQLSIDLGAELQSIFEIDGSYQ